jgi:succinate dehydrogenase flavin-adding protein (antitoxin of CptAB toxin-antitoxin module)
MAVDNSDVQSTENSTDEQNSAAPELEQAQNPDEGGSDSPPEPQVDYEGKIKALEEQYRRAEERNRYLEQTARLLDEDRRRLSQQYQQPAPRESDLAPELMELDKTLDPLFSKRLQSVTQPLVDTVSRLYDEQDSSRFEMYLMRNHPEVFDDEGGIDKVFQEVEAVRRQAAQNYNQWLSRVDAFLYAQGIRGVQSQAKSRKEKKSVQVREEAKRMQQVKAVGSSVQNATKKAPGAEIQAIREKAQRGERLSDSERAKYRDFVAGVTF